jgi:protein ImuA
MSVANQLLSRGQRGAAVHRAAAFEHSCVHETLATGCDAVDALLPGGGWPQGALVELIQSGTDGLAPTQAVCSLLLPALVQLQQERVGCAAHAAHVAWVGTVGQSALAQSLSLFGPSLLAKGLDVSRLVWVQHASDTAKAWAAQELLRCGDVAGVVVSLAHADAHVLRRLHYSAAQHGKYLWAIRPAQAMTQASPAVLRMQWRAGGWSMLEQPLGSALQVRKRAGPSTQAVVYCMQASTALQQAVRSTKAMRGLRRASASSVVKPHVVSSYTAHQVAA